MGLAGLFLFGAALFCREGVVARRASCETARLFLQATFLLGGVQMVVWWITERLRRRGARRRGARPS
jgi:hypothetical protein